MSLTPCYVKDYQPPTLDEITISSAPLEEMTGEDLDNVIRVQISMKQKGTDVKGRYRNIELHQVDLNKVFSSCENLLSLFPKQPRKKIAYYTRVQLQNKKGGKMKGGRNLSLHNATPEEIHTILYSRFKTRGWI